MEFNLKIVKPSVSYTPPVNAILSVLETDSNNHWVSLCENFIGMTGSSDDTWIEYENYKSWDDYRTLNIRNVPRPQLNEENFEIFISKFILSGFYMLIDIDTYYICQYLSYHKYHYRHELFIYGYDNEAHQFSCRDFFDFTFYTDAKILASELHESVVRYEFNDYLNGLVIFKPKPIIEINSIHIDWNRLNTAFKLLVMNEADSDVSNNSPARFNYFEVLKEAILSENKMNLKKNIHFLFSHISIMVERINLLSNRFAFLPNSLEYKLRGIQDKARTLDLLAIKCCAYEDTHMNAKSIRFRIGESLLMIKEEYGLVLSEISNIIEINCL